MAVLVYIPIALLLAVLTVPLEVALLALAAVALLAVALLAV